MLATFFVVLGYNPKIAYAAEDIPAVNIASESDCIGEDIDIKQSNPRTNNNSDEPLTSSTLLCPPQITQGLIGEYFDTAEPTNASYKRLIRIDENPEFNWQYDSPDPVIEPDTFSVIWSGFIEVPKTGTYTFYTYSDDGVVLSINNQLIINRWGLVDRDFTTSAPISLQNGTKYKFKMQYQEIPLNSAIILFYQCDGGEINIVPPSVFWVEKSDYNKYKKGVYCNQLKEKGNGLKGEYYIGADEVLKNDASPILVEEGEQVKFEWGIDSPGSGIPNEDFSARWAGYIEAKYTEPGKLVISVDDGIRLWSYNQFGQWKLFLDKWQPNPDITYEVPIDMRAGGIYKIMLEYNELGGTASCNLRWKSAGQEEEVIPIKYLYNKRP